MGDKKLTFFFINDKKRIKQPFIKRDLELIAKVVNVICYKNIPILSDYIKNLLILPKLVKSARKSDFIYGWRLYNYLAILIGIFARKPVILVAAGSDTAYLPKIKYGEFCYPLKKMMIKFNLKFTYQIRFVDIHLKTQLEKNTKKNIKNYSILPTFYDSEFWIPGTKERKYILTVSTNFRENKQEFFTRFLVKGIDRFLKLAKRFPEEEFLLIGYDFSIFKKYIKNIPTNFNVIEKLLKRELLNYYQQTKVYCQFSRHEGLPNAVCEAMLCGCNIIASNVKGILTAVNNFGTIINFQKDIWKSEISELFLKILNNNGQINIKGRKHVIRNFDERIFIKRFTNRLINNLNTL